MTETTNYGLNIVEGTDLVNPLTQLNPNFDTLDEKLKDVSDASVGKATELKTGTVHALLREDADVNMFRFTATSNFTAGDTFTVDDIQVSALLTSGEQLATGAYIIGSEVLCCLKGTLLTVYTSGAVKAIDSEKLGGELPSYYAKKTEVDEAQETATGAGELAQNTLNKLPKVIWTNPNPSAEFPSQTITIPNLSDYDYIEVYNSYETSVTRSDGYTRTLKGGAGHMGYALPATTPSYGTVSRHRHFTTSGNTITFSDCTIGYTSSYQVNNNSTIPIKIVGGYFA